CKPLAIRRPGKRVNKTIDTREPVGLLRTGDFPQANHAVAWSAFTLPRGQHLAIRRPRDDPRAIKFAAEFADLLAGFDIPESRLVIPTRSGQRFAIRRPGQGLEPVILTDHLADHVAGGRVPQADSSSSCTCSGQRFAVWGPGKRINVL